MTAVASHLHLSLAQARPRALAVLSRLFGNLDLAEDAFQEASLRALRHWPSKGMPDDPVAWLARVGRNAGIDLLRRSRAAQREELTEDGMTGAEAAEDRFQREIEFEEYRDDVLRLLFMCCHPELSLQDQLALALKVIAGLSVAEIARAFVVQPKTMEQRITRAKKRAAAVAAALETPTPAERARRVDAVSSMIYLLFNEGYSASGGPEHIRVDLCEEAIRIARLLLSLFPGQAEVMGLLALCLLHHSRRSARLGSGGRLIPLDEQDRSLWEGEPIAEGCALVEKALRRGRPGKYQIQAAIAAVHCRALSAEATDWAEIERLYAALEQAAPSPIVTLNRAVAVARTEGPVAALDLLEPLATSLVHHLHFYSTRAALRRQAGDLAAAREDFAAALELGPTASEEDYLRRQLRELKSQDSRRETP